MLVSRKRKKTRADHSAPRRPDRWPSPGPWAAVRSARDAVRGREELVAWLDTSPSTPANAREVMLAEAAEHMLVGTKGRGGSRWQLCAATGLPVTASTSP